MKNILITNKEDLTDFLFHTGKGRIAMDRHSIRYFFEHQLLPKWFFENKGEFVALVLHDQGILFRIVNDIFEKNNVENPYTENDFKVEAAKLTDELMMVKLVFPEPEETPLCYWSYLFFDLAFDNIRYFTVEKGLGEYPFVCSWTVNGSHSNYGTCTLEEHNDFVKCVSIYMGE